MKMAPGQQWGHSGGRYGDSGERRYGAAQPHIPPHRHKTPTEPHNLITHNPNNPITT